MHRSRMSTLAALALGFAFLALGCADQSSITDPADAELRNGPPDGGGGPPDGKGPGGGGHEPGATNNLSVPLINIGGSWTGVTCPLADEVLPSGTPLSGYEIEPAAYYYVQGEHTWQAECVTSDAASAGAFWGDNLAGDAKLKVGMPIRVEIGLEYLMDDPDTEEVEGMDGFSVVKLEPSKLDRESTYGTLATCDAEMTCSATVTTFTSVRVFDSGATWSVQNLETLEFPIPQQLIGSEINATGKAVYGYNLRVSEQGAYRITFNFPNVTITGVDAGTQVDANTVYLDINVVKAGGGGGGGKPDR